jgi:hypothetical protein
MFFPYVIEEMGDNAQLIKDYSLHLSTSGDPPWLHQPDFGRQNAAPSGAVFVYAFALGIFSSAHRGRACLDGRSLHILGSANP